MPARICASDKVHYPTATAAWRALQRRLHRPEKLVRPQDRRPHVRRWKGHRVGQLGCYRCRCGQWCIGHQPVKG